MSIPRSILVAEDDLLISMIIDRMLDRIGVKEIITVRTESDAIHKTWSHKPDLVLLDVHLLEGNGLDAFASIRETSDVPIVVMTGSYPEIEDHPGISNYLIKPFESTALKDSLRLAFQNGSAAG